MSQPPPPQVEDAPQNGSRKSARLLDELAGLLQQSLPPAEFHAEFLKRVLAAVRAVAGAVWVVTPQGMLSLQYQINRNEVGLDRIPNAHACHAELLQQAATQDRPLWLPPRSGPEGMGDGVLAANLAGYGLLLAPVLIEGEAAGILEVWLDFYPETQSWKPAGRFLMEVSGFAAAYLHRARFLHLQEQQRLWSALEGFVRRLHASLHLPDVAHLAANEGRLLLGCDQLSVAVRHRQNTVIQSVSGASSLDRRGRLARRMQALCDAVLRWGEPLVYNGTRDESLPPEVSASLDSYLSESDCRLLILFPLLPEGEPGRPAERQALLAEHFDPNLPAEVLRERLRAIAPHVHSALSNATEHSSLPLAGVSRALREVERQLFPGSLGKLAGVCTALLLAGLLLAYVPAPLRLDARGQLLPKERQTVFSPLTGKVVEVKAASGDRVGKAQELLLLEDLETQGKVDQLTIKINSADHRLAVLNQQLTSTAAEEERDALVKERIEKKYELARCLAERDLLLEGRSKPRRTPVASPLSGKVVTFDAREQLLGKTVKPGDPLLRVASFKGPWEVVLHIPEENIAQVREGLHRSADGSVEVALLLSSQPTTPYRGRLRGDGLAGETIIKEGKVVLPARAEIADPALLGQLETLPVGAEVRARVHCGNRSVGYVWLGGLLEFFYERLWF